MPTEAENDRPLETAATVARDLARARASRRARIEAGTATAADRRAERLYQELRRRGAGKNHTNG